MFGQEGDPQHEQTLTQAEHQQRRERAVVANRSPKQKQELTPSPMVTDKVSSMDTPADDDTQVTESEEHRQLLTGTCCPTITCSASTASPPNLWGEWHASTFP